MEHNETFTYKGVKLQFKRYQPCKECYFYTPDRKVDFCNKPNTIPYCGEGGFIKLQK